MSFEWPDEDAYEIADLLAPLDGISRDEALARLRELRSLNEANRSLGPWHSERTHRLADMVLLALIGDPEVTAAFAGLHKWYS